MNSITKDNPNEDFYSYRNENKSCLAIKKGCTSNLVIIPSGTAAGTALTVASATLNTDSLCASALISYCANIMTEDFSGTLTFQVFKVCRNGLMQVPVGSSGILQLAPSIPLNVNFMVWDSDICHEECCTYTIVATVR